MSINVLDKYYDEAIKVWDEQARFNIGYKKFSEELRKVLKARELRATMMRSAEVLVELKESDVIEEVKVMKMEEYTENYRAYEDYCKEAFGELGVVYYEEKVEEGMLAIRQFLETY